MKTTLNKITQPLTLAKTILFALSIIVTFVLVAIICGMLTEWIPFNVVKIAVRELVLRVPLTIYALHLFAGKVIKAYNPAIIYGKLTLLNTLKWTVIGFILPSAVWLFYYVSHFATPYGHSVFLASTAISGILVKWTSISIAAGLTEEVLFRGHLFMILRSRYSPIWAIAISSLIFGLVHITMLRSFSIIDISMVVVGGFISAIMFSCIYRYSGAIWYAAIAHGIWDIFFIGKIIAISASQADANQMILPFKLTTNSLLLTGGDFGIEAAIPSLLVYLSAIAVLCVLFHRRFIRNGE